MAKKQVNSDSDTLSYMNATGKIDFTLRNDMMFHRVMQSSNVALKHLICSLKGLDPSTVKEVTLTNPIDYSAYNHKEIILDVKVLLNNNEILDIELQLYYTVEWKLRSLLYLCRSFDSIGAGKNYLNLKPTTFIAIMDDPLFPEHPEFYSHYQLLNTKNHQPYTDYLSLNVLYLGQTELATEEDIQNGLLYWAELFKAKTWEELKALCRREPGFEEVAKVMYNSNIQDQERTLFEAHQRYLMEQYSMMRDLRNAREEGRAEGRGEVQKEYEEKMAKAEAEIESLRAEIERLKAEAETKK
jgi:predicted transposase/invertase (TIGR01784 family)